MTWNAFNRREEILRAVVDTADLRLDGLVPDDVPGVIENFPATKDLVAALLLKWHARLSGNIERLMFNEPLGLEEAVATAWRRTAEQLPGVRLILDRAASPEADDEIRQLLERAQQREWSRLALSAGLANEPSTAAAQAGRRIEQAARAGLVLPEGAVTTPATPATPVATVAAAAEPTPTPVLETVVESSSHEANASFVRRLKAVLAA